VPESCHAFKPNVLLFQCSHLGSPPDTCPDRKVRKMLTNPGGFISSPFNPDLLLMGRQPAGSTRIPRPPLQRTQATMDVATFHASKLRKLLIGCFMAKLVTKGTTCSSSPP
jgi:hypothetical protein